MTIRSDPQMTAQIDVLNNHSNAVGEASYNIGDYQTRAEFVNAIAAVEGSSSQLPDAIGVNRERRRKREEEDDVFARERAEDILKRDKKRRKETLSAQMRVKPSQRDFLQTLITENFNLEIHKSTRKKFPGTLNIVILNVRIKNIYFTS